MVYQKILQFESLQGGWAAGADPAVILRPRLPTWLAWLDCTWGRSRLRTVHFGSIKSWRSKLILSFLFGSLCKIMEV